MSSLSNFKFLVSSYVFLLLLLGCGQNESSRDDVPPVPPRVVPRSADNAYAQTGVRPEPTANDNLYRVRLEWYPNSEPDVAGYRIWRRREDVATRYHGILRDLRFGVNLDRGPVLAFLDAGDDFSGAPSNLLAPDRPGDSLSTHGWVWYIQAYDEANNHSELSDSIYFRLINNPRNLSVIRQAPGRYSLNWQFTANNDPGGMAYYYMIRVYQTAGGLDSVMWHEQVNRYGDQNSVILNEDGTARAVQTG